MRTTGSAASVLLAFALCAAALPPPKNTPSVLKHVLRIPVSGDAAAGLQPSDLAVKVAGSEGARIVQMRTPDDDLMLLLVMDVIGDPASIDAAREAVIAGIRTLPKNVHVGVLRAQDGLHVLLDPTADRVKVETTLRMMPTTGAAGLLNTAETAARLADSVASKAAVRVALLYITDGTVRDYREDFTNPVINSSDSRDLSRRFPAGLIREKVAKVSENLTRYQAPVSIVHLDYSSDRLNEAYQSGLLRLAAATGGDAVFCRSTIEIPDTVQRALDAVRNQYRILVQLPPDSPRTVQVTISHQGRPLPHRSRFVLR